MNDAGTFESAWTLRTRDGLRLHVRDLGGRSAARTLVVVHGYGEHGGRYVGPLRPFVDAGYRVVLPDMRGHGKSDGRRGHVMRYDDYVRDLDHLLETLATPPADVCLLGHSNGGLIALRFLLTRPPLVARAAVTAPLLGLAVRAPKWKVAAGRVISRHVPVVSLPTEIEPRHLSHDPAVVRDYEQDPLNHHVVNSRWFTEAEAAMVACHAEAGRLAVPLLVIRAGDDRLVDSDAVARWADRAPPERVTSEHVPGAFHEVLFETDGARHVRRLLAWFSAGESA